jgi:RNA polymerase-binding protein DksA
MEIQQRTESLRALLNRERNLALARVREYRAAQEEEVLPPPSDELDIARSLEDLETHASLIERVEERLRSIDFAFNLLEQGRYGICTICNQDIPVGRLETMPFAAYCVDCQEKRERREHLGEGKMDEPFARRWDVPEEMAESTETSRDEFIAIPQEGPAEEEPNLRAGEPLGAAAGKPTAKGKKARARKPKKGK